MLKAPFMMRISLVLSYIVLIYCSCGTGSSGSGTGGEGSVAEESNIHTSAPLIGFAVTGQFPHDTSAFTEGLLVHGGRIYESTGYTEQVPESRSWFGAVDTMTGKIHPAVELDKERFFGEGICFLGDKAYQLTYKEKIGFIYDARSFHKLGEFTMPGKEGWGMTTDGQSLLVSDGTSTIYYLDPSSMQTRRKLLVTENGLPPDSLNELEYIRGYIYANRYTHNWIFKIDPANGKIVGKLDCGSLVAGVRNQYEGAMELNGIAYDPVRDKVYITGKCWPAIYSIQFAH